MKKIAASLTMGAALIGGGLVTTTATATSAQAARGNCMVQSPYIAMEYMAYSTATRPKPMRGQTYGCAYNQLHSSIRNLQSALNRKGYRTTVDGFYGSGTRASVIRFQRANHLGVDGVVGYATAKKLGVWVLDA